MNRKLAREIAETISNKQLQQMFNKAKVEIKDWTKVSFVNKGMTKGAAWNILAKDFDLESTSHIMAKTNMIREFGEFLPYEFNPKKKGFKELPKPMHQEPKF